MSIISKFGIKNDNDAPIVVWVEPWAHDFTILEGEEIEIETKSDGDPQF